jgi:hypothetical protein
MIQRRDFIRQLIGGIAVTAAVRTWPFRVYSFPSKPEFTGRGMAFLVAELERLDVYLHPPLSAGVWLDESPALDALRYRNSVQIDPEKQRQMWRAVTNGPKIIS